MVCVYVCLYQIIKYVPFVHQPGKDCIIGRVEQDKDDKVGNATYPSLGGGSRGGSGDLGRSSKLVGGSARSRIGMIDKDDGRLIIATYLILLLSSVLFIRVPWEL